MLTGSRRKIEALRLVASTFPSESTQPTAWNTCAGLLPHAQAVLSHAEQLEPPSAWRLNYNVGRYLHVRGDYNEALRHLSGSLATRENLSGWTDTQTALVANSLAITYRRIGRLDEAVELHRRVITAFRSSRGNAVRLAEIANTLAMTLRTRAEYQLARIARLVKLLPTSDLLSIPDKRQVVRRLILNEPGGDERIRQIDDEFEKILTDLHEALVLQEGALESYRTILGSRNVDTLYIANSLSTTQRVAGLLDQALALAQDTAAAYETLVGPESVGTLKALNNLAHILRATGDFEASRALHRRILDSRCKQLGEFHPDTLRSRFNVGTTCALLGDRSEALVLHMAVLNARMSLLGPDHPETRASQAWADLLSTLGPMQTPLA